MLGKGIPIWLIVIALACVVIGPTLFVLRLHSASALEKFVYLILIYPLALIVLPVIYVASKKSIITEPNLQLRQARLVELRQGFRIVMFAVIPASVIGIAVSFWLLFIRLPGRK